MSVNSTIIKVPMNGNNGNMVYVNLEDTYLEFLPYDLRKKIQNYLSNAYLKTCFLNFKKTPQYLKDHLYYYAKKYNFVTYNIPLVRLLDVTNGYTRKWLYMAKDILTSDDLKNDILIKTYLKYVLMQFSSLSFYDNVLLSQPELYNYENSVLSYLLLYRKFGFKYLNVNYVRSNKFWWKNLNSFFNKRKLTQVNNHEI